MLAEGEASRPSTCPQRRIKFLPQLSKQSWLFNPHCLIPSQHSGLCRVSQIFHSRTLWDSFNAILSCLFDRERLISLHQYPLTYIPTVLYILSHIYTPIFQSFLDTVYDLSRDAVSTCPRYYVRDSRSRL